MDVKLREKKEKYVQNYTTGPLLYLTIQEHWDDLIQGKEHVNRFGVIDQMSSFEFVIRYEPDHPQNESGRIVFKMKADSFIVRLVVDPFYFVFRKEDRELVGLIGRMLPVGVNEDGTYIINAELVISR